MCGGGSIPIEVGGGSSIVDLCCDCVNVCLHLQGACGFPGTFHLAGDMDSRACGRCRGNMDVMEDPAAMTDLVKWSVSGLPLRTASVDAVVTDMVRCTSLAVRAAPPLLAVVCLFCTAALWEKVRHRIGSICVCVCACVCV